MLARSAFKSRLSRTRTQKRPAEKHAPSFLQWLRGRPCAVPGCQQGGRVHAAHVDFAGDKGVATKASDRFAIPLCEGVHGYEGHHAEQHRVGWATFQARYEINALALADEYFKAWPGRIAWLRKLAEAAE